MSRVVFMCGPSGSGKSTYARRLEEDGMVRLSFDTEMWRREISTVPLPAAIRDEIEADLRDRLLELVAADRDVVLDFSFWSRRMRDDYRALLQPLGVVPTTIYLATDRATVLDRVRARRGDDSDDYRAPRRARGRPLRPLPAPDSRRGTAGGDPLRAASAFCTRDSRRVTRPR